MPMTFTKTFELFIPIFIRYQAPLYAYIPCPFGRWAMCCCEAGSWPAQSSITMSPNFAACLSTSPNGRHRDWLSIVYYVCAFSLLYLLIESTTGTRKKICNWACYIFKSRGPQEHTQIFALEVIALPNGEDHMTTNQDLHLSMLYPNGEVHRTTK
jgi:hypothetical protein